MPQMRRLDPLTSIHQPRQLRPPAHQPALHVILRPPVIEPGLDPLLEQLRVLVGQDRHDIDHLGPAAMLQGILPRLGLALLGLGARALGGVFSVRSNLCVGGHEVHLQVKSPRRDRTAESKKPVRIRGLYQIQSSTAPMRFHVTEKNGGISRTAMARLWKMLLVLRGLNRFAVGQRLKPANSPRPV